MLQNAFYRRPRALDDGFYHRADKRRGDKLQEQNQFEADEDALAIACGIVDRKLLDELLAADVTPKTLAAFALFPAVYVAWSDGHVMPAAKKAVLQEVHDLGICHTAPAYQLLECWLQRKPAPELVVAWKNFIRAARPTLSVEGFQELREASMQRAHRIAKATGGFLGIGRVSAKEKESLAELEEVFDFAAAEGENDVSIE